MPLKITATVHVVFDVTMRPVALLCACATPCIVSEKQIWLLFSDRRPCHLWWLMFF